VTVVVMREPVKPQGGEVAGAAAVPKILADALKLTRSIPQIRWLLVAAGASGLAMVSVETFWQPIAATMFGTGAANSYPYALLATVSGVAVLAGSVVVMRWGQDFPGGPAALAAFGTLLRGGSMLLFALSATSLGLGAGLALVYFALATSNVPHDTLLHQAVPSNRRSSMLSVHSMVFYLGIALASGPLGWLATQAGPRNALAVAALVTVAASVAYIGVARAPAVQPAQAIARVARSPKESGADVVAD